MIIRTIRDIFTTDVDAIYIDQEEAYERAKEFLQLVMPRFANRLQYYDGKEPLFHKYKIDEEITQIHQREVPLRSGGSIVIDSDRGAGGDRRQQRQLPHRRLTRTSRPIS